MALLALLTRAYSLIYQGEILEAMEREEGPHILSLIFNHVVFPPKLPGRADPEGATEDV